MIGGVGVLLCASSAASGRPAKEAPAFGRVLSWRPRVFLYENFLSDEECDHLKSKSQQSRQFDPAADFNSVYFGYDETFEDKILWGIEERMAVITGSPPHRGEETMCIHKIVKSSDPFNIDEIHHDKVNKEFSSVTVLAFLEDIPEDGGGETIWPCGGQIHGKSVGTSCVKAFDAGVRWFNGEKSVVKGKTGQHKEKTSVHTELVHLRDSTNDGCAGKGEGFVMATPKKGAAVAFFHDHTNGEGDGMAWHTGCRVRNGTKWTMQKFKEMPTGWRGPIHERQSDKERLQKLLEKRKGHKEL